MRCLKASTLYAAILAPCLMGASCPTSLEPVIPDVVETAVNDDPNDPLWAMLDAEHASAELYGSKNAAGEIEHIERVVARSKRTGRVYTAEFDDQDRLASIADDLGNLALYTYSATEVRVDYVDQNGVAGSFSVLNADLPGRLKRADVVKPRDYVAQSLVVPDTVGLVTRVTQNGFPVDNAYVTASVDYGSFRLGGYYYRSGDYTDRYFTSFVNRREPFTAFYDNCAKQANTLGKAFAVTGAALVTGLTICAYTSPSPPGLICGALDYAFVTTAEVGLAAGDVITAFPEYACGQLIVPADPAVATIGVTATLPSGTSMSDSRTVDLQAMTHPRLLYFEFAFDTATSGDCAPNGTFYVGYFDNDPVGVENASIICVSGSAAAPTFSWHGQVPDVRLIQLYDETVGDWVWGIKVDDKPGEPYGAIEPPITYGSTVANVAVEEFQAPQPLVPGRRYRLELHTPLGVPEITFVIR